MARQHSAGLSVRFVASILAATLATAAGQDVFYAGGSFSRVGGATASNIARYDGAEWSAMGTGATNDYVRQLTMFNGDLYAGGGFTTIAGTPATRIARWDGNSWSELDGGVSALVMAQFVHKGALYVTGEFTTAGSVTVNYIAAWNAGWLALGAGLNQRGLALAEHNNQLIVGGDFTTAGGKLANHIAVWDGGSWSTLGSGTSDAVGALLSTGPGGVLYAGGFFTSAGGVSASRIAMWDGSRWSPLGKGVDSQVRGFVIFQGWLYAYGWFKYSGDLLVNNIARWDGLNWNAVSGGLSNGNAESAVVYQGELYIGGGFTTAGSISANRLAKWDGVSWSAFTSGADSTVWAVLWASGADCALTTQGWFSQYYEATSNVLVQDLLTFAQDNTFSQNLTAFPYEVCLPNTILWSGTYAMPTPSGPTIELGFSRCSQSGLGCLKCGPTRLEEAAIEFDESCEWFKLTVPGETTARVYFSENRGSTRPRE